MEDELLESGIFVDPSCRGGTRSRRDLFLESLGDEEIRSVEIIYDNCSKGHVDIVRLLLDSGAAMDTSASVLNPLFGAVYGRSLQVVKLLIDRGIDHSVKYTSKTMKNMDALAFARERGETEIAKYLATL